MRQRSATRAYTRELGLAMAAYVIVVFVSIKLVGSLEQPIKPLVAWTPRIPAALGRLSQLEAPAFGFGAAGLLTFAYGFLENEDFPQLSYIWVFPLMIFLWGIGGAIASYRYR